MAENETPQWGDGADSPEAPMNEELVRSFQSQDGLRGVHFYDGVHCEFMTWDMVIKFCQRLRDDNNPSHLEFEEKLLDMMSNINPKDEFVLCRQHQEVVAIECYRRQDL